MSRTWQWVHAKKSDMKRFDGRVAEGYGGIRCAQDIREIRRVRSQSARGRALWRQTLTSVLSAPLVTISSFRSIVYF